MWLLGSTMGLESFRRGYIGGSMLSLFVIKEFGLDKQAIPTLAWLRRYIELEEGLISRIPPFLDFLVAPFQDYHDAAKNYLLTLEILAELQRPPTCQYYWDKAGPELPESP